MDKKTRFKEITEEMADLYAAKNNDYGDSFGQSIQEFGCVAGLVRISDKFNRAKALLTGTVSQVKTESVLDSLTDLANYAIMLRMEVESIASDAIASRQTQ